MKILVTDGNSRAALAITRSLGAAGHDVFVAEKVQPSLAGRSRFCREALTYPDPADSVREFIDHLRSLCKTHDIDVLIPVSDITTIPVTLHREEFETICKLPIASPEAVTLAADKSGLMRLAAEHDVAVPHSVHLESIEDLPGVMENLRFPVVIKPSRSRVRAGNGWLFTSVDYANNARELQDKLHRHPQAVFPVLLQERIEGPGIGVFFCYQNGRPVAVFSHRRLREKPPSGGVSVLRESIEPHPLAREFGERLLSAIGWQGVAMVEFKLDKRDGIPKVMEINGRFWGSLQLAIDAGVNFPLILIDTLGDTPVQAVTSYRLGVKSRWLCGDLDWLLLRLLKSDQDLNLPPGYPSRPACLLQFCKFWGKDLHYEVLRRDDIRPWFHEMRTWLG